MTVPSPERILGLAQGGRAAWALACALELGVFSELGRGPRSRAQLCRRLGLSDRPAADLLDALVGLGLLGREGDDARAVYVNTRESGPYLDAAAPRFLGPLLRAELQLPASWCADAVAAPPPAAQSAQEVQSAQEALAQLHGDTLAHGLVLDGVEHLLDLRGAAARLACAIVHRQPRLQATSLEARQRLPRARALVAALGLADRVRCQLTPAAGPRAWPAADLIVWHGLAGPYTPAARWPARLGRWLVQLRARLPARGRLVLIGDMADAARRHSATVLLRGLAWPGPAAPSMAALDAACRRAGFSAVDVLPLPGGASAMVATA